MLMDFGMTRYPSPPTEDPPLSPLYDSLTTNLAHPVMCYSSLPFPPETPLFPKASVVHDYLRLYVKTFDLMPHIHLNTTVLSTIWASSFWDVRLSTGEALSFDRLIIANGHFRVPYYPPQIGRAHV